MPDWKLTADDRLEIQELYARYAWGIDLADADMAMPTFAQDCWFDHLWQGKVQGHEAIVVTALSEEHGVIELDAPSDWPRVGERLRLIPNHACVVSNLFDQVNLLAADGTIEAVPVAARGRVD